MKNLTKLVTNQNIKLNSSFDLNQLRYLKEIEFEINDKEIKIRKFGKGQYLITNFRSLDLPDEELKFGQLVQLCEFIL